ncbi:hypothetical protein T4C_7692 [Trichinella pseudospiralis]|uniref:Uncharacterized protein n=1 Tax=Trichinella pseudospiralis TaxID=6337 RepID=A0A0V1I320_TRIPS|nr:hypothetical protein T4C_7692 [Trichinella pseudospiralis]
MTLFDFLTLAIQLPEAAATDYTAAAELSLTVGIHLIRLDSI